jgi:uncharacterized lipoprotein YehR (DUF1307 family)
MLRSSKFQKHLKAVLMLGLALVSATALSGCDQITFNGSLQIFSPLTILVRVKKSDGFCDLHPGEMGCPDKPTEQIQKKTFTAGTYTSKMTLTTDRELKIEAGRQGTIALQVPKGASLPTNGEVTFTASQIGQPYDAHATIATTEANSQTMRDRERCSYQEPYTDCSYVNGAPSCHTSYRTVWGWQEVEYYLHSTDKHITVELSSAGTSEQVARYEGEFHGNEKVYTYKGRCW